jgi:hypothetical protein
MYAGADGQRRFTGRDPLDGRGSRAYHTCIPKIKPKKKTNNKSKKK